MVVDDEVVARVSLAEILRLEGYPALCSCSMDGQLDKERHSLA